MIRGGVEVVICSTISGAIWMFVPLQTRDDIDFYSHLGFFILF